MAGPKDHPPSAAQDRQRASKRKRQTGNGKQRGPAEARPSETARTAEAVPHPPWPGAWAKWARPLTPTLSGRERRSNAQPEAAVPRRGGLYSEHPLAPAASTPIRQGMPLLAKTNPELPLADQRPLARPDRHPHRRAPRRAQGPHDRTLRALLATASLPPTSAGASSPRGPYRRSASGAPPSARMRRWARGR